MRCFIEERLKRLEEKRKNALEMAQKTNQKIEESKKGKQSLISGARYTQWILDSHRSQTFCAQFFSK
jgi:F0F1-type ATP synthase membrane subunit b/b'